MAKGLPLRAGSIEAGCGLSIRCGGPPSIWAVALLSQAWVVCDAVEALDRIRLELLEHGWSVTSIKQIIKVHLFAGIPPTCQFRKIIQLSGSGLSWCSKQNTMQMLSSFPSCKHTLLPRHAAQISRGYRPSALTVLAQCQSLGTPEGRPNDSPTSWFLHSLDQRRDWSSPSPPAAGSLLLWLPQHGSC